MRNSASGFSSVSGSQPLTDLVHFASDPAFGVDEDLRIVSWNDLACEALGRTEDQVLNRPCYEVIAAVTPTGAPVCSERCAASVAFASCSPFAASGVLTARPDGRRLRVALGSIASPRITESGQPRGAVIFVRPLDVPLPATPQGFAIAVRTLGTFSLVVGDIEVVPHWDRMQALTLFKLLLSRMGEPIRCETVTTTMWPEVSDEVARGRLKVVLYSLRKQLESLGVPASVVYRDGEIMGIDGTRIWVDRDAFETLVKSGRAFQVAGRDTEAADQYLAAQELYRGDFLPADQYSEWNDEERERLREVYLGAMSRLASLQVQQGHLSAATETCRLALTYDMCRENLHRATMRYLWRQGRRDEALRQYERCERALWQEMDVEPMPKTQRLRQEILASSS